MTYPTHERIRVRGMKGRHPPSKSGREELMRNGGLDGRLERRGKLGWREERKEGSPSPHPKKRLVLEIVCVKARDRRGCVVVWYTHPYP